VIVSAQNAVMGFSRSFTQTCCIEHQKLECEEILRQAKVS
jgi:hypothetical protein